MARYTRRRSRSVGRRTARRSGTRRVARRSNAAPRTVRIVVEQAQPLPVLTQTGMMAEAGQPRKSRF